MPTLAPVPRVVPRGLSKPGSAPGELVFVELEGEVGDGDDVGLEIGDDKVGSRVGFDVDPDGVWLAVSACGPGERRLSLCQGWELVTSAFNWKADDRIWEPGISFSSK